MKLFLSCGTSVEREKQFIEHGFNRLFSNYSDRKKILQYIEMGGTGIILDSGAFSAYNSGKSVDIDDYIAFANSITEHCQWIVNLDVIGGDPQDSFNNFIYLRNHLTEPLKLMPVYHTSESIDWLYKYIDYHDAYGGCKSIGLGGIARVDMTTRENFLDSCEKVLMNRHDIWVHVLGVTTTTLIDKYSYIDSVDSVTWRLNAGYANVILPNTYTCIHFGHGHTEESCKRGYTPRELLKSNLENGTMDVAIVDCLNALELTIDDLYDSDKARELFNAYVLNQWAEKFVAKKSKKYRRLF